MDVTKRKALVWAPLDNHPPYGTFRGMNATDPHAANPTRKATVNGLAVVGFIALIVGGMLLVIYAARFIPETLSRLAGAVYLSPEEVVNPEPEAPVETPNEETPEEPVVTPETPTEKPPQTGGPNIVTYPTVVPNQLYGNPDLAVDVLAVGYLRTSSASSFVADGSIDENDRPAVRFRVRNLGTNYVNFWQVRIEYPSRTGSDTYLITSRDMLYPGGYKDFTFGFDDPEEGNDRRFTVTVDPDDDLNEGSESNNRDTATIDIGNGSNNNDDDFIGCDLEVSPSRIDEDERATLRWETEGDVDSARFNQGIGSVDEDGGSMRVGPNEDTTYRLTVKGDGEEVTCSVTLRVDED